MTGERTPRDAAESAMRKLDALFAGLPEDEQATLVGLLDAAAANALEQGAHGWAPDDQLPPFLLALRADVVPALFRALESRSLPQPRGDGSVVRPGDELFFDFTVSGD